MTFLAKAVLSAILASAITAQSAQAQDSSTAKDTVPQKPDTAAAVAVDLEALTGFYEIAQGRGLTITVEKGSLFGQPSTGEKRKLVHQSGTLFSVEGTKMTLTFMLGADGKASDVIMAQNGQQRFLPKR